MPKMPVKVTNSHGDNAPPSFNDIHPSLAALAVDCASLRLDPDNARLHPERSIEAIKASLKKFGQRKPIVVRRDTMTVVAGNGTLEAAKALGWTKIAASVQDMTDAEAVGYGLADNRVAELSTWDVEVVARLDKLLQSQGEEVVGWTLEEMALLKLEAPDFAPTSGPNGRLDELEDCITCPKCGNKFSGK